MDEPTQLALDIDTLNCGFFLFSPCLKLIKWNKYFLEKWKITNETLDQARSIEVVFKNHPQNVFNLVETLQQPNFKNLDTELLLSPSKEKISCRCLFNKNNDGTYQCLILNNEAFEKQKMLEHSLRDKIFLESFKEGYAESSVYISHVLGNKICSLSSDVGNSDLVEAFENLKTIIDGIKNKTEKIEKEMFKSIFEAISEETEEVLLKAKKEKDLLQERLSVITKVIDSNQKYVTLKEGLTNKVKVKEVVLQKFEELKRTIFTDLESVNLGMEFQDDFQIEIEPNGFEKVVEHILTNSMESIKQKMEEDKNFQNGEVIVLGQKNPNSSILIISDNGMGLEQEKIAKAFDLGGSTKGSLGEGLHFCSTFLQSHSGSIQIGSDGLYQGATIMISLRDNTKGKSLESITGGVK